MSPTLDETRAFVAKLFAGNVDKGGKPYAEHCFRVEARLPPSATEDERHAALLHDVIEDTDVTDVELHMGRQVTDLAAKVNANAADCAARFLAVENALRNLVVRIEALEAASGRALRERRPRGFCED